MNPTDKHSIYGHSKEIVLSVTLHLQKIMLILFLFFMNVPIILRTMRTHRVLMGWAG